METVVIHAPKVTVRATASHGAPVPRRFRQRAGFTLIEVMIVIACLGILGAAFSTGLYYLRLQDRATSFGRTAATLYDGLSAYVAKNYSSLISGAAVPGFGSPLAPTMAELSANPAQFLPANFSGKSDVGGDFAISIAVTPAGCTAQNCNVTWHVRTTAPPKARDGQVDMHLVSAAALKMGRAAGWSTLTNAAVVAGPDRSWTLPNPAGSQAGIILAQGSFANSQFSNFVRLNDSRDPNLQGNLSVAGAVSAASLSTGSVDVSGSIAAGAHITANGTIRGRFVSAIEDLTAGGNGYVAGAFVSQTLRPTLTTSAGAGCSLPNGAIAQNSVGALLTCQYGVWTALAGGKYYDNVNIMLPMGSVNLDSYLGSGYTAAQLTACGCNYTVDSKPVAYFGGCGYATCSSATFAPGTHSISGSGGWVAITGYWK